jgi:hypothetical protein
MILARTQSEWLKQYLKDGDGALTVTLGTVVQD